MADDQKDGLMAETKATQDIKAKWGERIHDAVRRLKHPSMMGGFMPLPRVFLRCYHLLGMNPTQAMVTLHLLDGKWDDKEPWITAQVLSDRVGRSPSQAKKYLAELQEFGVGVRYDHGSRRYFFDFEPFFENLAERIEAKMAEDVAAHKKKVKAVKRFEY